MSKMREKTTATILIAIFMISALAVAIPVMANDVLPYAVDAVGRPDLVGTISSDGSSVIFHIIAVGQADDGDTINPSKYYSQTNFDNEYFTLSAAGKFLKYNMFSGNTIPGWGTTWGDATKPLPAGVTFSQTQDGDDFVYDVSISYVVLGVSEGDTFSVQIKARDFNDDYVQSYRGYEGYDGEYSQYRGLWITDTGVFEVTIPPPPPIWVTIDIKPGSDPNSINLKSKGVVPVAVLTTDDFDAGTIDPDTVYFVGALSLRYAMCDVDDDGDVDMLFHFKTQELGFTEENTELYLWGRTLDGRFFLGKDTVNIVPKGK